MHKSRPLLLVEDDQIDARTVRRALEELGVADSMVHLTNGEEAMDYLRSAVNETPCLILLDLNMPRMNGAEFLKIAKADEHLKKIPVIVLTTSNEERDVIESFRLSVAGYIIKPVDYKKFVEAIRTIDLYWTLSEMPENEMGARDAQVETAVAG